MDYGFVRVAAVTPQMRVADVEYNAARIIEKIKECGDRGVQVAVFPELSLCGYTCSDLFLQPLLTEACLKGLREAVASTEGLGMLCFVGLPLACGGRLYNVAAAFCDGKLLGFVPKKNLPNYSEFYEERHFSVLTEAEEGAGLTVPFFGQDVPFGGRLIFRAENWPELAVGCEICEDLWCADPPSSGLARRGCTLLVNLSASNEIIGKKEYRTMLVLSQSGRCISGYVYASSGVCESTTDTVYSGHDLIAENGSLLAQSELFRDESLVISEIDIERLAFERRKTTTFGALQEGGRTVPFRVRAHAEDLARPVSRTPFVPSSSDELSERASLILSIQTNALAKRLRHTGVRCAVIGISGGLDSTLALLVTASAFDRAGLDRKGIIAVTMPGFGTTGRTHGNAVRLAGCVGATFREVAIGGSVMTHFTDIGHDPAKQDVTYENSQARMRTMILMDIANENGGLVIGTGDLSELALGWCTYNGDHMSMYAVNSSVPKTLVKYLVAAVGQREGEPLKGVLDDVLGTEISPELLPPDAEGRIAQKTEDLVGPYELHDFFLYYAVRWGVPPKKTLFLAKQAFRGVYSDGVILKWLKNFYRRFFSQQFKRSCIPDGVKVGSVTLSPRADWRMPSDAQAALWLKELEDE